MATADSQEPAQATAGQGRRRLVWLVVPVLVSLILGGATAWRSSLQSLWIDELHTSWSCADSWQEIVPRAAVGNQTPIYFAWQWLVSRTFGHSELALRATSMLAWAGNLVLLSLLIRRLVRATDCQAFWLFLCLAALDRQQIFFATEARPYMTLSLVVLLGWLMLERWLTVSSVERFAWPSWFAWVGCCAVAIWLQPTAALFIAAQFVVAIVRGRSRWFVTCVSNPVALAALLVLVWPMRYVLQPAWQGRHAWAAFAANLDWQNVLRQLPILVVAVPGAIAWLCVQYQRRALKKHPDIGSDTGMWLVAWTVPLAIVFVLTASEIAPLMHARYLFAATLPMTIWTACMVARLANAFDRSISHGCVWAMVVSMLLLQTYQQGSLSAWQSGRLAIAERNENWRDAVAYINQASQTGQRPVEVYCASNLIEGSRPDYLEGDRLRFEYLSLPLRAMYRPLESTQITPLLNDPRGWPKATPHAPNASTRWLIVRATPAGLAMRLQLANLQPLEQIDFGAVQLVRF